MRAAFFVGLSVVALCAGCQGSSDPWLGLHPASLDRQTGSNLAQHGIAVEQPERLGPADGKGPRKLVYHAEVDVVVEDLTTAEQELEKLLTTYEGISANAETVSRAGAPRAGLRRLRIPVAKFDAFLKALGDLGEVQRSKLDVQDVTRSHSELEEQIRNLAAEVAGLRELLQKPADKLADTLAIREQLSKASREMEGLKARLQRMQAQTEYSTVTLRMLERAAVAGEGGTLGTAASRAFSRSLDALVATGRGSVLFAVMLGPWLPILLAIAIPVWLWRRRRRAPVTA